MTLKELNSLLSDSMRRDGRYTIGPGSRARSLLTRNKHTPVRPDRASYLERKYADNSIRCLEPGPMAKTRHARSVNVAFDLESEGPNKSPIQRRRGGFSTGGGHPTAPIYADAASRVGTAATGFGLQHLRIGRLVAQCLWRALHSGAYRRLRHLRRQLHARPHMLEPVQLPLLSRSML